ncbi:MarC family protein [Dactylosporangium sp. NPDC049525]|uniref:MarC family protein n=1 Tax=Dactylosporangium sp. NPDC049525 TaxID=3154730 RepID=UPI00342B4D43
MSNVDQAVLMLLALVGLYSPVAAVSSYIPLVQPVDTRQHPRLALGLFVNVAAIAVVTILVGEPLLELLGLTTAALSATGGIALMIAAVPMMLGKNDDPGSKPTDAAIAPPSTSWRSVVFMPLTFPLTVGGATIAVLISFRALVDSVAGVLALTIAALIHAAITGACVYVAGQAGRRLSDRARMILDRVAGILLTAIAATLLASGFTRLAVDVLTAMHHIR